MLKDPLGDKIASPDGVALGAWTSDPDMIELLAHIGFDWVMIDQMFTGNDWAKTELLIRTAEAAGITPTVRLQAFPWLGHDTRLARDLGRAAGMGAKYIRMSVSCLQEMKECALVARDYHKKPMHIWHFEHSDKTGQTGRREKDATCLWPLAETPEVIDAYRDIIAMPEVKIFGFAMGDASRSIAKSDKPDFYNATLWKRIDEAVTFGRQHGTVIGANTSYAPDLAEMGRRTRFLGEHGVRVIMLQGAPFLLQIAIAPFLRDLRAELPGG
jgi:HpcH/HpaI aldolase/citrate lyase family